MMHIETGLKELGNQKEVENWSDILEDNWGLAIEEALFRESSYILEKE